jgi:hypothetical protein
LFAFKGYLFEHSPSVLSISEAEKAVWVARSEADKNRYLNELASYEPPPGFDAKGDAVLTYPTGKGKRGKPEKDINAPKRNVSAYLLYQNAMRDHFKRENPGMTFGQLSKYTSHMYKNLTTDEKGTWDARAAQDKARYDVEIVSYVPPPGHDARGVMIEDHRPRKRNKRGSKDPAAPKRASGAFVCFTNEARPIVMKDFPGVKFVEMGRVLGERWRSLPPDQKKRYEDMAAEDKVRFQMEMQQYTANQTAMAPVPSQPSPAASAYTHYDHDALHGYPHHDPYAHHDPYSQQAHQFQYHQA